MKRLRKPAALLLALVMALTLAACGGKGASKTNPAVGKYIGETVLSFDEWVPMDEVYDLGDNYIELKEDGTGCFMLDGDPTTIDWKLDNLAYYGIELLDDLTISTATGNTVEKTLRFKLPASDFAEHHWNPSRNSGSEEIVRYRKIFLLTEQNDGKAGWEYSTKSYELVFTYDIGYRDMDLDVYLAGTDARESAKFTNIYTENLTTVEVPFTKTVKLGGHAGPGKTDFTIAVCDVNAHDLSYYTDVKYTAAVTTNGAGDYDGKLIISGPAGKVSEFVSEGFYVREVNDGLPKWTYSDAVWFVSSEGEIFPARMETTDNGDFYDAINNADAVGKMTFENIYTRSGSSHTTPDEKPTSSPKTFDAGVALYGVSALLSLTGTALVIKRKNG